MNNSSGKSRKGNCAHEHKPKWHKRNTRKARQDPMVDMANRVYWTIGKQSWPKRNGNTTSAINSCASKQMLQQKQSTRLGVAGVAKPQSCTNIKQSHSAGLPISRNVNTPDVNTPPASLHLCIWRSGSQNMAALGQLQEQVASLTHIETWGAASFAGLPWVSPSPVQATTRLSEAAQKTSSPAW